MDSDNSATGRASDKFMLRLPDGMRDKLKEAAQSTKRTLNAEIVARLEQAFEQDSRADLLRGNMILLRALADFVLLRRNHPELMAPTEGSIYKMAEAIKATVDDKMLLLAAKDSLNSYIYELVAILDRANEELGPGWASKESLHNVAEGGPSLDRQRAMAKHLRDGPPKPQKQKGIIEQHLREGILPAKKSAEKK